MAVSTGQIQGAVHAYLAQFPEEADRLEPLLAAMREPDRMLNSRKETDPGHATASVLLVNPEGNVLYLMDDKRKRWLLPGGHLDAGDRSMADAALRELSEETGIPAASVRPLPDAQGRPVDIGVKKSPGSKKKDEPKHLHFDFRYAMTTDADVQALLDHQAACFRWMPTAASPPPRVGAKLAALL